MDTKRKLTAKEIEDILSFVTVLKGVPITIAKEVRANHIADYTAQLKNVEIYPSKIPRLRSILENQYNKAQIEPGKCVGALTAYSIGQINTQSSLSSFHSAGQNKVQLVTGIPRIEEILNASKDIKTPYMDVYLDLPIEDLKDLKKVKLAAQSILEYKELVDFLLDYTFTANRVLTADEQAWYMFNDTFYRTSYTQCQWSVRLVFDVDSLYAYRLSLETVANKIHAIYEDAHCVISPDNIGIIDVYIQTDSIGDVSDIVKTIKDTRKKKKNDQLTNGEKHLELNLIVNDDNKEYYFIRDLVIPSILYMPISGIEGIKKCYYEEAKNGLWMIKTSGSNLKVIIGHPLIVSRKNSPQWGNLYTTSNHLWDIYNVYGIEATRTFLLKELSSLISISNRHLNTLINCMTHTGRPMAVSRYGIDKKQVGVLAKVAFEQPFDNFFDAAMFSERETVGGISASITVGLAPPTGTGVVNLLDVNKNPIQIDQIIHEYDKFIIENMPVKRGEVVKPSTSTFIPTFNYDQNFEESAPAKKKSGLNSYIKPPIYAPSVEGKSKIKLVEKILIEDMNRLNPIPECVFKTKKIEENADDMDVAY